MRFIAIDRGGTPAAATPELSAQAREACLAHAALYRSVGFVPPWTGYLALSGPAVIGCCGFKSPPRDGRVEIAYTTFDDYAGHGFGTQMARMLVELARRADPKVLVAAQTLPVDGASPCILRKLGFTRAATREHPQDGAVWEWHLAVG